LKQHTIILVPHARAKFRKWRFTSAQAVLVIAPLALITLGGVASLGLWLSSSFDSQQLEQIRRENAELRDVNGRFESDIEQLETKLEDYQQRIHKLAIVAGLADLSPTSEPGIGGIDREPAMLADADGKLSALNGQLNALEDSMAVLQQSFEDKRSRLSSMPAVAPVKGIITSGFGNRRDPFTGRLSLHEGLDIVAPAGKEVRAPGDAIVTKAGWAKDYGNVIYLSHGYGVTTLYGHLSGIKVEAGQRVRRGDLIGFVGSTGRSTGTHLHYEVRLNGASTNPLGYILDDVGRR
jgi:murein DD-endopeptidase MepM/ murein hydrolase activator NlpD